MPMKKFLAVQASQFEVEKTFQENYSEYNAFLLNLAHFLNLRNCQILQDSSVLGLKDTV